MVRVILFGVVVMVGCASTEKAFQPPVVLPEDGAAVDFVEFEKTLRRLAWQANEAFYRDDWRDLGENAHKLQRASQLLKGAQNVPPPLQSTLANRCDSLAAESGRLKTAAAADPRSVEDISRHLQAVHNVIRTIRAEG